MITLKPSKSKRRRDRKKRKKALAAAQEINATLPLDENNAEETKTAAGITWGAEVEALIQQKKKHVQR